MEGVLESLDAARFYEEQISFIETELKSLKIRIIKYQKGTAERNEIKKLIFEKISQRKDLLIKHDHAMGALILDVTGEFKIPRKWQFIEGIKKLYE
jgi:hypothetical protein